MDADQPRLARRSMVRRQLAARGITSPRVLAAMATVPRHLFVPPSLARAAYDDAPLPVGEAQTISQPYMVALMTALLRPRRTHRVLEIGTGSGYQTAILAHLVRRVYTVERLPSLADSARQRLEFLGYQNVEFRIGDGSLGWPDEAPFDGIVVTAAVPLIPAPLIDQLAPEGRMAVPVGDRALQELIVGVLASSGLATYRAGACRFVPLIGAHAFTH
ncbi:MAG: protein-L-isoaspartate(D-aspartate) O-methyltransferase [Gemmatimonadales bacterium]|nr:protein-L-isoaspartate(D-aspartate) O-methyltransferase [Gemmatimonadales bacterium]